VRLALLSHYLDAALAVVLVRVLGLVGVWDRNCFLGFRGPRSPVTWQRTSFSSPFNDTCQGLLPDYWPHTHTFDFRHQYLTLSVPAEIEDFLTDRECELIMRMANKTGLFQSDSTYLDGSNLGDKETKAKKKEMTEEEADGMFRYSDQTWLAPGMDQALAKLKTRVSRLAMLPERVSRQSEQLQVRSRRLPPNPFMYTFIGQWV